MQGTFVSKVQAGVSFLVLLVVVKWGIGIIPKNKTKNKNKNKNKNKIKTKSKNIK